MGKTLTVVLAVVLLAAAGNLWGQSNEMLDDLLEQPATTLGQAAYLVLTASGRIPDDSSPADAAIVLADQGWTLPERSADESITTGEYSYLLMQAFELKGGVMYRFFPGARYAGKEFAYMEFIRGNGSPYRTFSGEEALGILGRLLEWKEGQP